MSRKVWFQLVDGETRDAFAGTSANAVKLSADEDTVQDLQHAVKVIYNDSHLKGVALSDLRVYADKAAYDAKQKEEEDALIGTRGESKNNPLIVEAGPLEIITVKEETDDIRQELMYNQQRGRLIQDQCHNYCVQILDKVDELFAEERHTLPFICVEGSSGMGKSQLAFALADRRPYFYWLAVVTNRSQKLYQNFKSISFAFRK